jgi:hypothetical protein
MRTIEQNVSIPTAVDATPMIDAQVRCIAISYAVDEPIYTVIVSILLSSTGVGALIVF